MDCNAFYIVVHVHTLQELAPTEVHTYELVHFLQIQFLNQVFQSQKGNSLLSSYVFSF